MTGSVRGVISVIGSKAVTLAVMLITIPIIARELGPGEYGDYAFLMSVLLWSMVLISLGNFDGVRKFSSESRGSDWELRVFKYYFTQSGITALLGSFFFITLSIVTSRNPIFPPEFSKYFLILASIVVVRQSTTLSRGILMGQQQEHYSEIALIIRSISFGILSVISIYSGLAIYGILLSRLVSEFISTIYMLAYLPIYKILRSLRTPIDREQFRTFGQFSLLTGIMAFLLMSLAEVDIIMIRTLLGKNQAGIYKSAIVVAEFIWFFPQAVQIIFVHSVSDLWVKTELERISAMASRAVRFTIIIGAPLFISLLVVGDDFILLYFGESYSNAYRPLLLLLPGAMGFALARPLIAVGQASGNMKPVLLATAIPALLNAVLNIWFIPLFGITGAAVATSVSYGSMFLTHTYTSFQSGISPFKHVHYTRIAILFAPALILCYIIDRILQNGAASIVTTSIISSIFCAIIGLVLFISQEELDLVISSIPFAIPEPIRKQLYNINRGFSTT